LCVFCGCVVPPYGHTDKTVLKTRGRTPQCDFRSPPPYRLSSRVARGNSPKVYVDLQEHVKNRTAKAEPTVKTAFQHTLRARPSARNRRFLPMSRRGGRSLRAYIRRPPRAPVLKAPNPS